MKKVNRHVVCSYSCCVGLREVRFDNGRFCSVECLPPGVDDDADDDTQDDEDDSDCDDGSLDRR